MSSVKKIVGRGVAKARNFERQFKRGATWLPGWGLFCITAALALMGGVLGVIVWGTWVFMTVDTGRHIERLDGEKESNHE